MTPNNLTSWEWIPQNNIDETTQAQNADIIKNEDNKSSINNTQVNSSSKDWSVNDLQPPLVWSLEENKDPDPTVNDAVIKDNSSTSDIGFFDKTNNLIKWAFSSFDKKKSTDITPLSTTDWNVKEQSIPTAWTIDGTDKTVKNPQEDFMVAEWGDVKQDAWKVENIFRRKNISRLG